MTTPNMGLTLPVVGSTIGPTWAYELNAALEDIDAHDHTSNSGKRITPAAINIDDDLSFAGYSVEDISRVGLAGVGATHSIALSIYSVGGDLYYNNSSGTPVKITDGPSVAGSSGSISNLVSPASVYYDSATYNFEFKQNSTTRASLDAGAVLLRANSSSTGNAIRLIAPSAASAYTLTLPTGVAASPSTSLLSINGSGNLLIWNLDNSTIEQASTTVRIKDAGVVAAKIAADAVETAKIKDGAVVNSKIADGTIAWIKIGSDNKDRIAAESSMRSLGGGPQQACRGDDPRLTDSRTPSGAAGGSLTGSSYPNPVIANLAISTAMLQDASVSPIKTARNFGYGQYNNITTPVNLSGTVWYTPARTVGQLTSLVAQRPFCISAQPQSSGASSGFILENQNGLGADKNALIALDLMGTVSGVPNQIIRNFVSKVRFKGKNFINFPSVFFTDAPLVNATDCYVRLNLLGDGTDIWLYELTNIHWIITQ